MIHFSKLRYKNLLSSGNTWVTIDLDRNPTTLVIGENGAGKSTMLDALTFGLFGKPFRKVNKPQLVSSVNEGDCMVEVYFTIGSNEYLVRRGIKPNVFDIEINGNRQDRLSNSRDSQAMLETQILKLNYKSFTQVIILGASTFVPFMQLTASNRRDVIEDLLDIEIFSLMNTVLKGRMAALKDEVSDTNAFIALEEQMVQVQTKNLRRIEQDTEATVKRHEQEIFKLDTANGARRTEILKLNVDVGPLVANTAGIDCHRKKLRKAEQIDHKLVAKKDKLERDIKFFGENDDCPTCQQYIDDAFKKVKRKEKSDKLFETMDARDKLKVELTKIETKIRFDEHMLNCLSTIRQDIAATETQITANETIMESLRTAIVELSAEKQTSHAAADIEKARKKLKVLEDAKESYANKEELQRLAGKLLRDDGIKTLIIKQYLPIMNKLINSFLAKMDFFVNFNLDEEFIETIKSRHRDEFSYASFSEGEKLRIDLALLFTWRMIAKLKNSTNCNLLILDEIFDSSLDDAGTQEFMKILWSLSDQNVFVISHKSDLLVDKFESVIRFEKVKGFSKIV